MDQTYFKNLIKQRNDFFVNNGKIIEPISVSFDNEKTPIYFPDIRCPFCEESLVTQPQAGLVEYRIKVKDNWTRLYLSFFMDDKFLAVRDDAVVIRDGDILDKVTCPICNRSLLIDSDCDYCHASLIGVDVNFFDEDECFNYEFCSKKGCKFYRIDISNEDLEKYFLSERKYIPVMG